MNHLGCIEEKAIKTIFAAANMNSTFDSAFKQIKMYVFLTKSHLSSYHGMLFSNNLSLLLFNHKSSILHVSL